MSVEQADGSGSVPMSTAEIVFQYHSLGLSSRRIHRATFNISETVSLNFPSHSAERRCRRWSRIGDRPSISSFPRSRRRYGPSTRFSTNVSSEDALVLLVAPSRAMQHQTHTRLASSTSQLPLDSCCTPRFWVRCHIIGAPSAPRAPPEQSQCGPDPRYFCAL